MGAGNTRSSAPWRFRPLPRSSEKPSERTTELRRSIPRSVRCRFLSNQCFGRCRIDSTLPACKNLRQQSKPKGPVLIHTHKSLLPPGPRVLEVGGDLSSDSSESHTDVARRDELQRTPGLVDSSGCLHPGSRGRVLDRGGLLAESRRMSGLPRGSALLMSQDYGPVSGHVLTPRGY